MPASDPATSIVALQRHSDRRPVAVAAHGRRLAASDRLPPLKMLRNGRPMEIQAADRLERQLTAAAISASRRCDGFLPAIQTLGKRCPRFLPAFEILERAAQPHRRGHRVGHHLGGLVAVAGDADDHRFVGWMTPRLTRSIVAGERRAAGRLGEDPFGLRQQLDRVDDLRRRSPPRRCRRSLRRSESPDSRRPGCRSRSTWRSCSGAPARDGRGRRRARARPARSRPPAPRGCAAARPRPGRSSRSSRKPRTMRGSSVPPATGDTRCCG